MSSAFIFEVQIATRVSCCVRSSATSAECLTRSVEMRDVMRTGVTQSSCYRLTYRQTYTSLHSKYSVRSSVLYIIISCLIFVVRPSSSVSTVTRLQTGLPGFDFRLELGFLLLATASRPALGPTHPLLQWVPWVKRSGRNVDHSPPSSAEVRMRGAIPPLPQYVFVAWCLIKQVTRFHSVVLG
jgi:hypothetical protein